MIYHTIIILCSRWGGLVGGGWWAASCCQRSLYSHAIARDQIRHAAAARAQFDGRRVPEVFGSCEPAEVN